MIAKARICKSPSSPLLVDLIANDFALLNTIFLASFIDKNVEFVYWNCYIIHLYQKIEKKQLYEEKLFTYRFSNRRLDGHL